jgi:N-acetylmuramoyl-L-alanine amidase
MRENAVILLEDDYETKYEGFNPNDHSSYIMFEFMQNRYRDNSIDFASLVQHHFTHDLRRVNRSVKEGEFIVLHRSACPAVLIELGFLSNPEEERYLNSQQGQNELALAISNAFDAHKREYDRRTGNTAATTKPSAEVNNEGNNDAQLPVFKVQIFSSRTILRANDRNLRGLQNVEFHRENGLYKYTTGRSSDLNEIRVLRDELQTQFPGAFIVAFLGDRKISVAEAQRLLNP